MTSTNTLTTVGTRTAVYHRVSREIQKTARQKRENREAAAARGYQVSAEYEDHGKSASRFARHGGRGDWKALADAVKAGQHDLVILWEVSRADRETDRWAAFLRICRDRAVLIYVTSKRRLYDPRIWEDREALLRAGLAAEGESEILSERVTSGKRDNMLEGRPGGSVAYGIQRIYKVTRGEDEHPWERDAPHPVTGPVAARIITEAAAGKPWAHIARDLDRDGIRPEYGTCARCGRRRPLDADGNVPDHKDRDDAPCASAAPLRSGWHPATLPGIAGNPVYARVGLVDKNGRPVSAKTFNTARMRVDRSAGMRQHAPRPARQRHRYSGALHCGKCSGPVVGYSDIHGQPRYRCKAGCVSIAGPALDAYVDEWCVTRLSRPDLVNLVCQGGDAAAAAAARSEAATLQAELDQWASADITPRAYKIREDRMMPKIRAALRRADAAEVPSALAGLPDERRAVVQRRWDALELSARRAAVEALAPFAILKPGKRGHASTGTGRHGSGTPLADRIAMRPDGI
jgi:DNA invertase Pin-like site-specific DNA recombinase